eukprot:3300479-Pleurochrysis_carterae.AAC.3
MPFHFEESESNQKLPVTMLPLSRGVAAASCLLGAKEASHISACYVCSSGAVRGADRGRRAARRVRPVQYSARRAARTDSVACAE